MREWGWGVVLREGWRVAWLGVICVEMGLRQGGKKKVLWRLTSFSNWKILFSCRSNQDVKLPASAYPAVISRRSVKLADRVKQSLESVLDALVAANDENDLEDDLDAELNDVEADGSKDDTAIADDDDVLGDEDGGEE